MSSIVADCCMYVFFMGSEEYNQVGLPITMSSKQINMWAALNFLLSEFFCIKV